MLLTCLPRSTIFPNKFLPRKKFRVEQFHRRFRNWCWHSLMAIFALLTSAANTPGFSRTSRRCFRRSVVCTAGSMYMMPDVSGEMLFGSPTFAMPLETREREKGISFEFRFPSTISVFECKRAVQLHIGLGLSCC